MSVTVGSCRINHLPFADGLVMCRSSEQGLQHAFDQFPTARDKAGIKNGTKLTRVLCLSRKTRYEL